MKVPVCALLAVIAICAQAQNPQNPGYPSQNALPAQNNPTMTGTPNTGSNQMTTGLMTPQSNQIMSNQGGPMMQNLLSAVMGRAGMMPNQMGPISSQLHPQHHGMYNNQFMHSNGHYGNQQQGNQGKQSGMNMLPFLFGGDSMRRMAALNMAMNPRQSNKALPFLFMDGMEGMLPMLAMTNNGGNQGGMNPMMMMALSGGM